MYLTTTMNALTMRGSTFQCFKINRLGVENRGYARANLKCGDPPAWAGDNLKLTSTGYEVSLAAHWGRPGSLRCQRSCYQYLCRQESLFVILLRHYVGSSTNPGVERSLWPTGSHNHASISPLCWTNEQSCNRRILFTNNVTYHASNLTIMLDQRPTL